MCGTRSFNYRTQKAITELIRRHMRINFDFITNLQYRVKHLTERVRAFESGEIHTKMKSEFKSMLAAKDRDIKKLKNELASSRSKAATMRIRWQQVFEDVEKEYNKKLNIKDTKIKNLEEQLLKSREQTAIEKDKFKEKCKELYQVKAELEEEQGRNHKLTAQVNRDYENSSISSSLKINKKKKIKNSREKTGRKPGGQPGHEHHPRKKQLPTKIVHIPAPDEYANNPNYKLTDRIIKKQLVNVRVVVDTIEYQTPEFRNLLTGQRVHADFPDGVNDDVNYGGSVKAFTFLLNNKHNVSIDNTRRFLSELTDGKLEISKGMINGLSKEFNEKTQEEQKKAFADILLSPVINVDFTGSRVNGENKQVMTCATPEITLYFAREHKGHEGVKGTPLEVYQHTVVHDHDPTFLNYARWHQECLAHILRYLLDSIENEPHLTWNTDMRELIREMIHYINDLDEEEIINPKKLEAFEIEYQKILNTAKEEYEYEPPTKYYREGFNLAKRMNENKENHLRFLHDKNVPATNNLSERELRKFKRKQKQVMAFRSFENLDYLCNCMSIITLLSNQGENLFGSTSSIFERQLKAV